MKIEKINKDLYAKFYAQYPTEFSVFGHPEWLAMYPSAITYYGLYTDNADQIGSFVLFKATKKGISYLTNAPYMPHIELVYLNPAEKLHQHYTYTKKILDLVALHLNQICKTFTYIALSPQIIDSQPFTWQGFNAVPNYTYHLNLDLSEQQILDGLSPKKRNAYKKAIKDGLTTKKIEDFNVLKNLIVLTFDRKKKGLDLAVLDKIIFQFANQTNSFAFCTYEHDVPIAAAFCIYDHKTCYYLLSGYDHRSKHSGAGICAVMSSIKNAQQLKLKVFDFEGSMLPEVEDYFREFGGQLIPYHTINKAFGLYKMPLELFKGQQF